MIHGYYHNKLVTLGSSVHDAWLPISQCMTKLKIDNHGTSTFKALIIYCSRLKQLELIAGRQAGGRLTSRAIAATSFSH